MDVVITYCPPCGLRQPAEQIAEALKRELGITCRLQEGFWGTFRIECDGEEAFNRRKTRGLLGCLGFGRLPAPEEIVALFRLHLALSELASKAK